MEGLLDRYLKYLEAERGAARLTLKNYRNDLLGFLGFLKGQKVASLDRVDRQVVRQYLAWLVKQGFARSSISRKLSALRSFYRFLVKENLLASDPLAAVSLPKKERRLPTFLGTAQVNALIEAPDTSTAQGQRDRAILELFYASGMRVSEVASLDLRNLSLSAREVRVMGKRSKERMVLIGRPAAAALEAYLKEGRLKLLGKRRGEALFLNRSGGRLSARSMQALVDKYARKVGIEGRVFPHMLRHTFATHMLEGGADLRVVQELLGHADLSSTQIYTHVTQSQVRRVYLRAHPRAQKGEE